MPNTFDKILDECVDRINRGQSLEDCLASYPEYAEELKPLLRAVMDVQTAYAFTPSPAARMAARQRFSAALEGLERRRETKRPLFSRLFGQSRVWVAAAAVIAIALIGYYGLRPMLFSPETAPETAEVVVPPGAEPGEAPLVTGLLPGEGGNFRFLLSDEVNDIDQFEHLYIHISSIGLQRGGDSGEWLELKPDPDIYDDPDLGIDLTALKGENAMVIWSGTVPSDNYTKVFIYVDKVTGILVGAEEGEIADVKLPSGKLQIPKPFEVGDDQEVNFVYDVTVIQAGKSSQYNLKPQIDQSGADQKFKEVKPEGATERHEEKKQGKQNLEEEFEGTILSIGKDGIWTMDIDGEEWTVDVSGAAIEGQPAVDLEAEVKGTLENDIIIASEVEIKGRSEKQSGKQGG